MKKKAIRVLYFLTLFNLVSFFLACDPNPNIEVHTQNKNLDEPIISKPTPDNQKPVDPVSNPTTPVAQPTPIPSPSATPQAPSISTQEKASWIFGMDSVGYNLLWMLSSTKDSERAFTASVDLDHIRSVHTMTSVHFIQRLTSDTVQLLVNGKATASQTEQTFLVDLDTKKQKAVGLPISETSVIDANLKRQLQLWKVPLNQSTAIWNGSAILFPNKKNFNLMATQAPHTLHQTILWPVGTYFSPVWAQDVEQLAWIQYDPYLRNSSVIVYNVKNVANKMQNTTLATQRTQVDIVPFHLQYLGKGQWCWFEVPWPKNLAEPLWTSGRLKFWSVSGEKYYDLPKGLDGRVFPQVSIGLDSNGDYLGSFALEKIDWSKLTAPIVNEAQIVTWNLKSGQILNQLAYTKSMIFNIGHPLWHAPKLFAISAMKMSPSGWWPYVLLSAGQDTQVHQAMDKGWRLLSTESYNKFEFER